MSVHYRTRHIVRGALRLFQRQRATRRGGAIMRHPGITNAGKSVGARHDTDHHWLCAIAHQVFHVAPRFTSASRKLMSYLRVIMMLPRLLRASVCMAVP